MSDDTKPEALPEDYATTATEEYTQENVDVLRDAAHIRERPEMYIGSRGTKGFHHLVYELVANSVDESLAGFCKNVNVHVYADGSLSVTDDGRGIPVEEHAKEKVSTLQVVMTVVGAGGKFRKGSYKVSAGLHGMGAKAVTALSEWSEATVYRNGRTYRQQYERGKPVRDVEDIGASKERGTKVTFKPDPQIFGDLAFDYETLEERLRELAYLNKGLTIALQDDRTNKKASFRFDRGIVEFVEHINRNDHVLHAPIVLEKTQDDVKLEVAMQYITEEDSRIRCYGNNAYNYEGGTHQSGFFSALSRAIGSYGRKEELFKKAEPEGKDYREGLSVVLSVQVPEPKFDSQEKRKLTNVEVEGIVTSIVNETLTKWLEEHPNEAKKICKKVETAAEAREAAAKARKALKDRKGLLSGGGLPGKLFDCTTSDRAVNELFLVEGDSAGGSAVGGRDSEYQAILPLRGKLINVEKARLEAMLDNREITSLISAIGVDITGGAKVEEREDAEPEKVKPPRYGKIVILTDADVDGQHIRTLLLTFFYRQMPRLVVEGHIYVARPPLYKVTTGKGNNQEVEFISTADAMTRKLNERGLKKTALRLLPLSSEAESERRLEGNDLEEIVRVTTQLDLVLTALERSGVNLNTLIGKAGTRGLPEYRVTMATHEEWFFTAEEQGAFLKEQEKAGYTVASEDRTTSAGTNGATASNGSARVMYPQDFHGIREVNKLLPGLAKFGLLPRDLVPQPRVAGREPPPHLILEADGNPRNLAHLRDLVFEVRRLGERGLTITRFKGLGEMDPEELWDTTLDPDRRTLLQVQLDDALKADEMFRTLMGDKVEPRREFILENARQAEIDQHSA